jgi:tetratricopeptide (TPR) repeat protein
MFERAGQLHSVEGFRKVIPLIQVSLDELAAPPPPDPAQSPSWEGLQSSGRFFQSYAHWRLGDLTGDAGHFEEALRLQREGLALTVKKLQRDPSNEFVGRNLADNLDEIGYTLTKLGRYGEAEASFLESISRFEKLAQTDPSNVEAEKDIADACRYYASSLDRAGRKLDALRFARRSSGIYKEILSRDPANKEIPKSLAEVSDLLTRSPVRH